MEAAAAKRRVARRPAKAKGFAGAAELRAVLDRLLSELDADPDHGLRLYAAGVPHRYEFPDLDVVLDVSRDAEGRGPRWSFDGESASDPKLRLRMDSEVANRYLQGKENLAIAMARGRIRCSGDARAALSFLPDHRLLIEHYRRLVERDYPHLAI